MNKRARIRQIKMLKKQNGKCHYCDCYMHVHSLKVSRKRKILSTQATFDHIIPKCEGGTYVRNNLVLAGSLCNTLKGNMDYDLFIRLRASPFFKQHILSWKQNKAFYYETRNRLKPFRTFVYI